MEVFRTGRGVGIAVVLHRIEETFHLREVEGIGEYVGCGIDQLVGLVDDAKVARQQAALIVSIGSYFTN